MSTHELKSHATVIKLIYLLLDRSVLKTTANTTMNSTNSTIIKTIGMVTIGTELWSPVLLSERKIIKWFNSSPYKIVNPANSF